jgi:RecA/RadA recombinase
MKAKDAKKKLTKKKAKNKKLTGKDFLSTGSTLLNLASTGRPYRGFMKGKYYFVVGDSSSGKTFLILTCLAEAGINPDFSDYRFIYDNGEDGALMDIEKFFGKAVKKRMEAPSYDKKVPVYSETIEEFYYNVDDALKINKPFIYILDSMDVLSSKDEAGKFDEGKTAHRRGKKVAGSYGDGKAKKNSAGLRRLIAPLRASGSILIILSQTRDNIGFGFEKKTRSGGKALRFYATLEIWSSVKKKIMKTVKGKPRQVGIQCQLQTKKNRITGKEHKVVVPIYNSFGFDNTGSCVDYLIDENHWKGDKKIDAKEFGIKGTKDKIIKHIEDNDMEKDLIGIVGDVWCAIEVACRLKRKPRYGQK